MSGEEGSRHSDSKNPAQPPVLAGIRHEEVLQSETPSVVCASKISEADKARIQSYIQKYRGSILA